MIIVPSRRIIVPPFRPPFISQFSPLPSGIQQPFDSNVGIKRQTKIEGAPPVPPIPPPAITQTAHRAFADGTATMNHSMPAPDFAFQNNKLYLICITSGSGTTPAPVTSTLAAGNISWVLERRIVYNTLASPKFSIDVWRGLVTSGATISTLSWLTDINSMTYADIVEFSGVHTTGTSGSDAVPQSNSKAQDVSAGTIITVTLGPFGGAQNATFSTCSVSNGNRFWTEGAGFTEIEEFGAGGAAKQMEQWKNINDGSIESTLDVAWDAAIIAAEIAGPVV